MDFIFKQENITTVEEAKEFRYLIKLDGIEPFSIHLSDEGAWVADNCNVNPTLVSKAGDFIEGNEDFQDVLLLLR